MRVVDRFYIELSGKYDEDVMGVMVADFEDVITEVNNVVRDLVELLSIKRSYEEGQISVVNALNSVLGLYDLHRVEHPWFWSNVDILFGEVSVLKNDAQDHLTEVDNFIQYNHGLSNDLLNAVSDYIDFVRTDGLVYAFSDDRLINLVYEIEKLADYMEENTVSENFDGYVEGLFSLVNEVALNEFINFYKRSVHLIDSLSDLNVKMFYHADQCGMDLNEIA